MQPSIQGYLTNEAPSRVQFRKVFLVATGIVVFAVIVNLLFASARRATWDESGDESMVGYEVIEEDTAT